MSENHRTPEKQAHMDRWNAFSRRFDAWLATKPDTSLVERVVAQAATMHDPMEALTMVQREQVKR